MKFGFGGFFEISRETSRLIEILQEKKDSLHEDRHICVCIYDISLKSPYDMTFLDINWRENRNTRFVLSHFFRILPFMR
jgi:hypothetical protein